MGTHLQSLLNARISTLNRNVFEAPVASHVFGTVIAILAFVRDEAIRDKNSVELSEYCFNACHTLKNATQGKSPNGFNKSQKMAIESLDMVMCEIKRTLRKGLITTPHVQHLKEKTETHMFEIQQSPSTPYILNSPLDGSTSVDQGGPWQTAPEVHDLTMTPVPESACDRLIGRSFTLNELPSLIEAMLSNEDERETALCLPLDDAQTFIDVVDEALHSPNLPPLDRKRFIKLLYRTCSHYAFLPKALDVPVSCDQNGAALYRGGYADVWKGKHCGRDVAVKVIRTYSNCELQKVISGFCREVVMWRSLRHPNILPLIGVSMSENRFAMVSDWMANGNINEFVKSHPGTDKPRLLVGVAEGLLYLHDNGMTHGDLKGANILIDGTGHARLADFGLLTILSDPANFLSSSSCAQGGTVRWMGPELIDPERFGFEKRRPTESSDCYALGMVIYETISGELPFRKYTDYTVSLKVMAGERPPRRPRFTDSLWDMLQLCWTSHPDDRPSVGDVLRCLQTASNSPEPSSRGSSEGMEEDSDDWDPLDSSPPTSKGKKRQYDPDLTLPPIINQIKRRRVRLGSSAPGKRIRLPPIRPLLHRPPEFLPAFSNPNDPLRSDHGAPSHPPLQSPPTRYQESEYHPRNSSLPSPSESAYTSSANSSSGYSSPTSAFSSSFDFVPHFTPASPPPIDHRLAWMHSWSSPSPSPTALSPDPDNHAASTSDQSQDNWAFPAHPRSNSLTSGAARPATSNPIASLLTPATTANRSKVPRKPRKTIASRERVRRSCDETNVQLVE